jgi:hypothetical protein
MDAACRRNGIIRRKDVAMKPVLANEGDERLGSPSKGF